MNEKIVERDGARFLVVEHESLPNIFHVMTTADMDMKVDLLHYPDKIRSLARKWNLSYDSLSTTSQVHGDAVGITGKEDHHFVDTDALIGGEGDLLTIKTADCIPVSLLDPKHRKIALIHAGWRGTFLKIVSKTVEAMCKEYGSRPQELLAYIGTSISKEVFEVERDVIDRYRAAFNFEEGVYKQKNERKYLFDLKKLNRLLLEEAGVLRENITLSEYCTYCNPLFHSFRRDGKEKYGLMVTMLCWMRFGENFR